MKAYKDINGDSGVSAYDYGDDWIKVQFKHGGTYEYRASKIGSAHLSRMKRLADTGDGLILRATWDAMLLSPPLIITRAQVDELFDKTWKALNDTAADLGM